DLFHCFVLHPLSVFRGKRMKTSLDFLPIKERHRKKADTAMGTASATGEIVKERGLGPVKPASSFFK
ncbi:MAG: hypothetical protein OEW13_14125, partial [Nitrospira sp.]|nr:hypothetical protein [Nitrospira sp.]